MTADLATAHVRSRDIVADALATIRSQLGRSVGVGIAAALGIATLIGTTQLAISADARVAERIEAARPEVLRAETQRPATALDAAPTDADLVDLAAVPGVRGVSLVRRLNEVRPVRSRPNSDAADTVSAIAVISGDLDRASRLEVTGRSFTDAERRSGAHVALVGRRIAVNLDLADARFEPTIWIAGTPHTVIGIIEDSETAPDLIDHIAIPRTTAITDLGAEPDDGFGTIIYVRAGKDDVDDLADTLATRLRPEAPETWRVEVPRTSIDLATDISEDVRNLAAATGALVLFVGAVAIGNAMLRNVYSRFAELGLRRTLGARSGHIAGLLLTEAAVIGVLAGIVGVVLGYGIAMIVAIQQDWPMAPDPRLGAGGLVLAVVAALVGAAWPSRVATRVSPAEALRRD